MVLKRVAGAQPGIGVKNERSTAGKVAHKRSCSPLVAWSCKVMVPLPALEHSAIGVRNAAQ